MCRDDGQGVSGKAMQVMKDRYVAHINE
ncbi:hypothetical protein BCEN4_190019 [Burkholderia cenocepacia]|nr:hypothetical protein BCEN4_190019 [Burkholderia cenocepacia]